MRPTDYLLVGWSNGAEDGWEAAEADYNQVWDEHCQATRTGSECRGSQVNYVHFFCQFTIQRVTHNTLQSFPAKKGIPTSYFLFPKNSGHSDSNGVFIS